MPPPRASLGAWSLWLSMVPIRACRARAAPAAMCAEAAASPALSPVSSGSAEAARFATSAARSAPSAVAVPRSARPERPSISALKPRVSARTTPSIKGSPEPRPHVSSRSPAASAAPRRGTVEGSGREASGASRLSSPAATLRILAQEAARSVGRMRQEETRRVIIEA